MTVEPLPIFGENCIRLIIISNLPFSWNDSLWEIGLQKKRLFETKTLQVISENLFSERSQVLTQIQISTMIVLSIDLINEVTPKK